MMLQMDNGRGRREAICEWAIVEVVVLSRQGAARRDVRRWGAPRYSSC